MIIFFFFKFFDFSRILQKKKKKPSKFKKQQVNFSYYILTRLLPPFSYILTGFLFIDFGCQIEFQRPQLFNHIFNYQWSFIG